MYFRIKSTCMQTFLPPSVFSFLADLKENNHREWFQNNKTRYQEQYNYALQFADELLLRMKQIDTIGTISGKKSLFRINKDVRFSNKNLIFFKRAMYKFSVYARRERRTLFKKDFGLIKFDWKNNSQSKLSIYNLG